MHRFIFFNSISATTFKKLYFKNWKERSLNYCETNKVEDLFIMIIDNSKIKLIIVVVIACVHICIHEGEDWNLKYKVWIKLLQSWNTFIFYFY